VNEIRSEAGAFAALMDRPGARSSPAVNMRLKEMIAARIRALTPDSLTPRFPDIRAAPLAQVNEVRLNLLLATPLQRSHQPHGLDVGIGIRAGQFLFPHVTREEGGLGREEEETLEQRFSSAVTSATIAGFVPLS